MLELNKDAGSHMVHENDIVYVLTVPVFWSENAIDFMRNAAKMVNHFYTSNILFSI